MKALEWSPEKVARLRNLYATNTAKVCAELMNENVHTVKRILKVHKLTGRGMMKVWTPEMDNIIRELYPETKNVDLAAMLGVSEGAVSGRGFNLGIKKTQDFMRRHSAAGMFKPGQVPPNKGKKMSPEIYEKARPTMFKKGNLPHNTRSDGELSIRPDKRGVLYRFIRIDLGKWLTYSRFVWEKENGPVPKGMCVWHKDLDSLNDDIANLELITRKENYLRNSGSVKLSDTYVLHTMTVRKSPEFKAAVAAHPELIETKRLQLQLNREIKKTDECDAKEESRCAGARDAVQ